MNTLQTVLFREFSALPLFQVASSVEQWEDAALLQSLTVAPNPCSVQATIGVTLPQPARVVISLHDLRGRQLTAIDAGDCAAGRTTAVLPVERFASGTYFVRVQAGSRAAMKALFVER
jgi:hypothetical protein